MTSTNDNSKSMPMSAAKLQKNDSINDEDLDSDDEDVSSGWSAQDSIDREIKEMRKLDRKKEKREKLMIEKEIQKDQLGAAEKQRLKEITMKGKRPPSGRMAVNPSSVSKKDAEKIA